MSKQRRDRRRSSSKGGVKQALWGGVREQLVGGNVKEQVKGGDLKSLIWGGVGKRGKR